jgi:hypothetical protein
MALEHAPGRATIRALVRQRRTGMAKKSKGGKNVKKPKQDKAKKGPSGK